MAGFTCFSETDFYYIFCLIFNMRKKNHVRDAAITSLSTTMKIANDVLKEEFNVLKKHNSDASSTTKLIQDKYNSNILQSDLLVHQINEFSNEISQINRKLVSNNYENIEDGVLVNGKVEEGQTNVCK